LSIDSCTFRDFPDIQVLTSLRTLELVMTKYAADCTVFRSLSRSLPCLRRLLRTRFGTDDLRGVSNSGLHQSLLHQLTSKRSCRARNEYADKKHLRETFFSNLAPARAVSASHLASTLRPSRHPNAQCGAPLPSIRLGARAWTCGSHEHICSRSRNMLHILLTC
jgi:hypothetical protein